MSVKYRADIDGLRAVAVIAVVLYHAFPHGFKSGFIGVDVFFVISGYLITSNIIASRNRQDFFSDFYSRRIRRIFPALILVLLFSMVYGWLYLMPEEYRVLGKHVLSTAFFSTNIILWLESGYFDVTSEFKPLLHMWSLGVEEQFYIVWPFVLLWSIKSRGWWVVCLTVFSFGLCVGLSKSFQSQAFYLLHTRLWELAVGGLISLVMLGELSFSRKSYSDGWFSSKISLILASKGLSDYLSFFGFGLLIASLALIESGNGFPGWHALGPVLGASFLICAGPNCWLNRVFLSHRFLVVIGLISYPLYLWHWPLLTFARISYDQAPPHVVRALLVVLSFVLAYLTYKYVESPFRGGISRRRAVISLSIAMSLVLLAGWGIFVNGGVPSRVSTSTKSENIPEFRSFITKYVADPNYLEHLKQGRRKLIRAPVCHLNEDDGVFDNFRSPDSKCLSIDPSKENILVLGDSHGADLYAVLQKAYGVKYHLLQATAGGCNPDKIYAVKQDRCSEMIRYALDVNKGRKLHAVYIAARWKNVDVFQLKRILDDAKKVSDKIVFVSPPVSFMGNVPRLIIKNNGRRSHRDLANAFFDKSVYQRSAILEAFSKSNGADYLNRIEVVCGEYGYCPLVSSLGDPYTWDYGHLSPFGIEFIASKLRSVWVP